MFNTSCHKIINNASGLKNIYFCLSFRFCWKLGEKFLSNSCKASRCVMPNGWIINFKYLGGGVCLLIAVAKILPQVRILSCVPPALWQPMRSRASNVYIPTAPTPQCQLKCWWCHDNSLSTTHFKNFLLERNSLVSRMTSIFSSVRKIKLHKLWCFFF